MQPGPGGFLYAYACAPRLGVIHAMDGRPVQALRPTGSGPKVMWAYAANAWPTHAAKLQPAAKDEFSCRYHKEIVKKKNN